MQEGHLWATLPTFRLFAHTEPSKPPQNITPSKPPSTLFIHISTA